MSEGERNRLSFSTNPKDYAAYRPTYPKELYEFLASVCEGCQRALGVGTGNGQTAIALADLYQEVVGIDASMEQLSLAAAHPNVRYIQMDAEDLQFPASYFDLITVATALHWFELDRFYPRVQEILKAGGIFAAWGYGFFTISPEIDAVIKEILLEPIDPFWANANRLLEQGYRTIPFPFEEVSIPDFRVETIWSSEQMIGFVSTWSAVKRYRTEKGVDVLTILRKALRQVWPDGEAKPVVLPLALRVGRNPRQ